MAGTFAQLARVGHLISFRGLTSSNVAVYIEGVTGDIFAESEDALSYHEVFDHLRAAALSPTDSRQRISGMWEVRP